MRSWACPSARRETKSVFLGVFQRLGYQGSKILLRVDKRPKHIAKDMFTKNAHLCVDVALERQDKEGAT